MAILKPSNILLTSTATRCFWTSTSPRTGRSTDHRSTRRSRGPWPTWRAEHLGRRLHRFHHLDPRVQADRVARRATISRCDICSLGIVFSRPHAAPPTAWWAIRTPRRVRQAVPALAAEYGSFREHGLSPSFAPPVRRRSDDPPRPSRRFSSVPWPSARGPVPARSSWPRTSTAGGPTCRSLRRRPSRLEPLPLCAAEREQFFAVGAGTGDLPGHDVRWSRSGRARCARALAGKVARLRTTSSPCVPVSAPMAALLHDRELSRTTSSPFVPVAASPRSRLRNPTPDGGDAARRLEGYESTSYVATGGSGGKQRNLRECMATTSRWLIEQAFHYSSLSAPD